MFVHDNQMLELVEKYILELSNFIEIENNCNNGLQVDDKITNKYFIQKELKENTEKILKILGFEIDVIKKDKEVFYIISLENQVFGKLIVKLD